MLLAMHHLDTCIESVTLQSMSEMPMSSISSQEKSGARYTRFLASQKSGTGCALSCEGFRPLNDGKLQSPCGDFATCSRGLYRPLTLSRYDSYPLKRRKAFSYAFLQGFWYTKNLLTYRKEVSGLI